MSSGGKAPPPADYTGAAREQGLQNLAAARLGAELNRVNQTGPTGSIRYTQDPNNPDSWTQTTELSPEQQAIFSGQQGNQLNLSRLANQRIGQSQGQTPLEAYDPGDFGAQRQEVTDAQYRAATQYLDPQFEQSGEALRTRLLNSGVREGSEAYTNEMGNFDRSKQAAYGDARSRAILAGGSEQSRLLADALRGRQQQVNERQIPLEESLALMQALGGGGAAGQPAGSIGQVGSPAAGDYQTAAGQQYADQWNRYSADEAQAAQTNSQYAQLATLASMFLYASDRRLKLDIERIGCLPIGVGVYRYRYLWDAPHVIRMGVMADEVLGVAPHAVDEREGYLAVDYATINATHLVGVH
jgi:hypothetical protein